MQIIQINCTYGSADSTGRNTMEMHRWLLENGYDSRVWISRFNDTSTESSSVKIYSSAADRLLHSLLSRITGLQGYFSAAATRKIITDIRHSANPVVILGVLHNNSIHVPMLCRFLAKHHIPTVIVLHDCWFFTGHCCYYSEINCTGWKADCSRCASMRQWNKSWFFNTAKKCLKDKRSWFSGMDHLGVVGVSDWIAGEAKQSILENAARIQRIYNWIDLETFRSHDVSGLRARLGLTETDRVLMGVAAIWNDKKGLRELLAAAEKFPDSKVILVGALPQNIDLPENVIAPGVIKDAQLLSDYYALADVFVNPSVQETFGKTTAEALCCGTPVVAYETTACTELVGADRGILVPLGNTDAFMQAIGQVLRTGKAAFSESCRTFAAENFSKDKNIQQYVDLAKSLL